MFAFVSQLFSSPLYFGLISSSPNPLQAKPEEVLIDKELQILDQTERGRKKKEGSMNYTMKNKLKYTLTHEKNCP